MKDQQFDRDGLLVFPPRSATFGSPFSSKGKCEGQSTRSPLTKSHRIMSSTQTTTVRNRVVVRRPRERQNVASRCECNYLEWISIPTIYKLQSHFRTSFSRDSRQRRLSLFKVPRKKGERIFRRSLLTPPSSVSAHHRPPAHLIYFQTPSRLLRHFHCVEFRSSVH